MKTVVLAAALAALASPAFAAGQIPDGTYQCNMDDHLNGEIVIAGDTYKGPNYDGKFDGTYKFAVSDNNITWNGPLGIYTDPGIQIVGSMVVKGDGDKPAIEIHVRQDGSDNIHIANCDLE